MSGIGRQSISTAAQLARRRGARAPAGRLVELHRQAHLGDARRGSGPRGGRSRRAAIVGSPRKKTSEGCSAVAARPKAAEPMSGGRVISAGVRRLAGLDLEAPPVVGRRRPRARSRRIIAHGQFDVGLLVERALDLDRRSGRWRRARASSRPEIHCESVPAIAHWPPVGRGGCDRDRRPSRPSDASSTPSSASASSSGPTGRRWKYFWPVSVTGASASEARPIMK